jgi:hypothetical protein
VDVLRPERSKMRHRNAGSLIISTDIEDASEIIKHARLLNPDLQIMVRCAISVKQPLCVKQALL